MEEQNPQPLQPQTNPTRGRKSKKVVFIPIIIVIILIAVALAFFFLRSPSDKDLESSDTDTFEISLDSEDEDEISTPTQAPTPEPLDREEITIEVLNATGIAKQASFLQEKLEDLGYSQIETGNAGDQEQEETTVSFSDSVPDQVREEILSELENLYTEVTVSSSAPDNTDVLILAGLRTGQSLPEPEPTEEPENTATESAEE